MQAEFFVALLILLALGWLSFQLGKMVLSLLAVLWKVIRCDRGLWERNRQAAQLARRFNRYPLTQEEHRQFEDLCAQGLLTFKEGRRERMVAVVSDMAIQDVFG